VSVLLQHSSLRAIIEVMAASADPSDDDDPTPAPGVRARVRAELTAEIKASARRQLATDGAAALSLRAISRELDMASSAIYRYFESRDELLTALIIDAYNAVGDIAERADAGVASSDHRGRFVAIAQAIRTWACENPHEYALIFGSPVPGYAAPQDTIDPATRVPVALLTVLVDHHTSIAEPATVEVSDSALTAALEQLLEFVDHRVPASVLAAGVQAWGEIFGLVSLELFGHFNNAVTDPELFFAHAMEMRAEWLLGPGSPESAE